jgi:riboflavin synthase|tara:strand:+ start:4182 stop:4787 length:606 start_codon:yes stop_codon:yes gene_type:complete
MFTGIVAGMGRVESIDGEELVRLVINFSTVSTEGLEIGASVSVNGVCLTAVELTGSTVAFDVISETLNLTTLGTLAEGNWVNLERALKVGDEIGGHLLSGHVMGTGEIIVREETDENMDLVIDCPTDIMRFIQPKGYIAIDGISLTVGRVEENTFSLHIIPETLRLTTLGVKGLGSDVNLEVDSMTQTIVATVERMMEGKV